ncbi:MAG: hypothetical protein IIC67_00435 [Thaumarchaeota archaeon]|nr:hypothetical protein [Nitrososphaerota archaeon]
MKSVIIIAIAFVLLIPISAYSEPFLKDWHFGELQWSDTKYTVPDFASLQIIEPDT